MLPGEQVKDVKFQESWYSLPAKVLKGMEIFRYTFNITVTHRNENCTVVEGADLEFTKWM